MKKGFTLIELLVVIAIIAILAAILFPVFAQAREKARATSCLSGSKQIATAIQMYTDDYDETLPGSMDVDGGGGGSWDYVQGGIYSITYKLQPYMKNYKVFACPSSGKTTFDWGGNTYETNNKLWNGVIFYSGTFEGIAHAPTALASISAPANIAACVEFPNNDIWQRYCYIPVSWGYWSGGRDWSNKHNEGMNIPFLDGHAKFYKRSAITSDMFGLLDASGNKFNAYNTRDVSNGNFILSL